MSCAWRAIAEAEFLVSTSRFRSLRYPVMFLIYTGLIGWALLGAPALVNLLISRVLDDFQTLLSVAFPGLLRSAMLFLFMLVMVGPISNSLEEIRIGQWEIIISHNVRTRDLLLGTFIAKIPIYGLIVFILAPIIIAPFAIVYEVSLFGQILMYLIVLSFALVTLWISTILGTAIQAKLGDSPRGNDLAKGFSWLVIILIALPGMALIYFMDKISVLMSLEPFLLLPSTWSADLLTWCALHFTNGYIPASTLLNFESILCFPPVVTITLFAAFSASVVAIGIYGANALFTFGSGTRTEKIVTVTKENLLFRGIRRLLSGGFGVLVVTSMKDFGRKMQNASKLIYAMFLAIIIPFLLTSADVFQRHNDPLFLPIVSILTSSLLLGVFSAITFGGVGFLDSKDQLWMLKSAPRGDLRFISARILSYMILALPLSLIPSTANWLILNLDMYTYLIMFVNLLMVIASSILVGMGVTSLNPGYDGTKSSAYTVNSVATTVIMLATMIIGLLYIVPIVTVHYDLILAFLVASVPLPVVGLLIAACGAARMSRRDG